MTQMEWMCKRWKCTVKMMMIIICSKSMFLSIFVSCGVLCTFRWKWRTMACINWTTMSDMLFAFNPFLCQLKCTKRSNWYTKTKGGTHSISIEFFFMINLLLWRALAHHGNTHIRDTNMRCGCRAHVRVHQHATHLNEICAAHVSCFVDGFMCFLRACSRMMMHSRRDDLDRYVWHTYFSSNMPPSSILPLIICYLFNRNTKQKYR